MTELQFRRARLLVLAAMLLLMLTACSPASANPNTDKDNGAGYIEGFTHGFILPVAALFSFFDKSVGIYEVHNNGNGYNLGFVMGASISLGGSTTAVNRNKNNSSVK